MNSGVIQLNLHKLGQLFEVLDPSPFRERDLDRSAEEFIVESVKELPPRPAYELVLYVDEPPTQPDEPRAVEEAVRVYFARRATLLRRDLSQLMHRGRISLAIGIAFLATLVVAGQLLGRLWGESTVGALLRESLLIVGWVAMWRPIEIFLYDWWPIAGERRLYDRLSRITVRIVPRSPGTASPTEENTPLEV